MLDQIESILSEIAHLPPEDGMCKVTNYGTAELRAFARSILECACPECESKEGMFIDNNVERRICRQCGACYRPEDLLTVALLRAHQVGVEEGSQASNTSLTPSETTTICANAS